MSAPEVVAAPVAPVEEVKPVEPTPAPEAAKAEEPAAVPVRISFFFCFAFRVANPTTPERPPNPLLLLLSPLLRLRHLRLPSRHPLLSPPRLLLTSLQRRRRLLSLYVMTGAVLGFM